MKEPKAYIFDVFGTVVDWRTGVAREAEILFRAKNINMDPFEFADAWRNKYDPAMQRIRSGNRGYIPLDILHRENLDEVLLDFQLEEQFDETERARFNKAWEKLPAWPDSRQGLHSLKEKAIIAPCSNGSIALMTRLAKFAALPWDCILGSEIAKNYKPHPDAYLKSVAAIDLEPQEVVMVAAHNSDLIAARENGLRTAFIPRLTEHGDKQVTDIAPSCKWDYIIEKIEDLALM